MKIDITHVAKLTNLPLKTEEKEILEKQLVETISYINKLNEIDTSNTQPTSQVSELENVTSPDETSPSLSQEQALKNAKSKHNGFFRIKAILED